MYFRSIFIIAGGPAGGLRAFLSVSEGRGGVAHRGEFALDSFCPRARSKGLLHRSAWESERASVPGGTGSSPDPAAFEVTEREDLRSRSPSPELPAPEFPDTDPLASSTDTEPMTPDQS